MALPQQLKTARMDDTTIGSTIDNKVGELEQALADILGVTVNVDVTASPFSLDNSGRITKALIAHRAAGPVGWRMRDTTSGKEVRLVVNGSNFDIDENTGSEGTPAWTNRFRMAVADGALTGAVATTSRMGLCPQGDGNALHFLNGQLGFTTPAGLATIPSCKVRNSANQSIPSSSLTTITFDTEDWDTDTMHSTVTNTSRITAKTAGKYLVIGGIGWSANTSGFRLLRITKGGGVTTYGRKSEAPVNDTHGHQVRALVDLAVNEYVEMDAYQTSGSTLNSMALVSYAPFLSAHKVA